MVTLCNNMNEVGYDRQRNSSMAKVVLSKENHLLALKVTCITGFSVCCARCGSQPAENACYTYVQATGKVSLSTFGDGL